MLQGLAYLTYKTLPLYLEPLNEPASLLERLYYTDLKKNSLPYRQSLDRHDIPKLAVADHYLEATGLETEPDSQSGPGLKLEPEPTRAELDLGLDILDPGLGSENLWAEPG